jgi:serine protease Do
MMEAGFNMRWTFLLILALAASLVLGGKVQAQSDLFPRLQPVTQGKNQFSYLGVYLVDVDADRVGRLKMSEERGVEVVNVGEGSPADNAGIKPGDVILGYNGENVLGTQQFSRLVRETPPGRKVKLQLWRDGKAQSTLAIIGALPSRTPAIPTQFANFNLPDIRGVKVLDVPSIIMTWTNSAVGIECEPVDSQLAQYFGVKQGVLVRSVAKDSAGEKAGFKAGDVLTAVGGRNLTNPEDLRRILRQPGKPAPVSLVRDHKQLTLTVTPLPDDQQ